MLRAIPPTIATMSKQGAISAFRSEVVLAHAPHGDYVFGVITKNQKDRSWERDNQGFVFLRDFLQISCENFEPARAYTLPEGTERYR